MIIELGATTRCAACRFPGTEDNLAQMTQAAQKAGARVLLVGMQVPPNYGSDYAKRFAACSRRSKQYRTGLVPFLLRASPTAPTRARCSRPTASTRGRKRSRMLDNVWPELKKLLK